MKSTDCKKNCKQKEYKLSRIQRRILIYVHKYYREQNAGIIIKNIVQTIDITHRRAYYNVNKLIEKGFLKNISKGTKLLFLTEKGKQFLEFQFGDLQRFSWDVSPFLDRAHSITLHQEIIQRGKVPDCFNSSDSTKLNWKYSQLTFEDNKRNISIRVTPSTVIYYFKERYGPDPEHIVSVCISIIYTYTEFFNKHNWKLQPPDSTTISQHHALYNNEFSKFAVKFKINYKSNRLHFDRSKGFGEFELVHPSFSPSDFIRLTDFFEAILRGDLKLGVLFKLTKMLPELEHLLQNKQGDVEDG